MASWKRFSKAKYHELQRVTGQPMNVIPYLLRMKAVKKFEPVCARLKGMLPRMKIYCRICSCKSVQNTEAPDQDLLKSPHFVLELSDALFCPSLPPTYTMLNSSQEISLVFLKKFFHFGGDFY